MNLSPEFQKKSNLIMIYRCYKVLKTVEPSIPPTFTVSSKVVVCRGGNKC
jgi:hypothetical protein